jgi:hypothetical protein
MEQLLDFVPTPYAACIGDDDFLVPSSLEQCVLFLDSHPDYSAAHGVAGLITLNCNGAHGRIEGASYYQQPKVEGDTASQRLADHLSNYTVALFSVHRIDTWRVMYRAASMLADKAFGGELLPCCLSAIAGKAKQLDCLYLVRQVYNPLYPLLDAREGNPSESSAPLNVVATTYPDLFGQMTSSDWLPSYEVFRDCLAKELAKTDEIGLDEAQKLVERQFWYFLARGLSRAWHERYMHRAPGVRSRVRMVGRRIAFLRWGWQKVQPFLPGEDKRMSLPALLHPSLPYHTDFMPIYRAFTNQPPST